MKLPVSTVILTRNEEEELPDCLSSLSWCDDIHVVDSQSSDQTLAIAEASGATCYSNPFLGFGQQRNWAIDNCSLKHEWILFLDADERSTEDFVQELYWELQNPNQNCAGYYLCSKTMLDGRWLKRADGFPKWQFRLARKGFSRFEDFGHGQREVLLNGELKYLKEPYLHYSFSKGWSQWIARHNVYSSKEAELRLNQKPSFEELFSKHSAVRLKSLRLLLSRVPGWPLMHFIIHYIFYLGLLEGRAGLAHCINKAYYEFLIRLKMREFKR